MKTIIIELDVECEGDDDDAMMVVEALLDEGVIQDAINEHSCDDAGPLKVTRALCREEDG